MCSPGVGVGVGVGISVDAGHPFRTEFDLVGIKGSGRRTEREGAVLYILVRAPGRLVRRVSIHKSPP